MLKNNVEPKLKNNIFWSLLNESPYDSTINVENANMNKTGTIVDPILIRIIRFIRRLWFFISFSFDRLDKITFLNTPGINNTTELHCADAVYKPNS